MHFEKSKKILEALKNADTILINIHRNPDLDSVGSALAFKYILAQLGKKVTIIGPHPVEPAFTFLPGANTIKTVDFHTFDFKPYDLFLILDSASSQIVTSDPKLPLPSLPLLVIDHHKGNNIEADIKLVKEDASASAEIIYYLLQDWKMKITKDLATILFSAICHDTVFFKYTENDSETFPIISDLIKFGADKNAVLFHIYNNLDFEFVKQVALVLSKMKQEDGFIWTALNYEEYEKMGRPVGLREYVSDHFIQSVKGA
ncbi:DHH family phosphoesterase [Candidatus Roizmanbacteria bacterium]|nr:DHH family phosphoesterase [Candidatus Roizmanbacteria bacterium]